jgi:nickel transport protein
MMFILLVFPVSVMAHGAKTSTIKGGVGIAASYLDNSPMADCDVRVFSPEDRVTPFQTGQTDDNGRFMFFPDKKGEWKVIVDDGMGHRADAAVTITQDMKIDPASLSPGGLQQWQKILMGLCLIFGFTGIYFYYLYYLARKKSAAETTGENNLA